MASDDDVDEQRRAFAAVGRELLAFELQTAADDLHVEFNRAARKAQEADRITEDDAHQLLDAIERAGRFVDSFYDACPEADRPPAVEDVLSEDELQSVFERMENYANG